MKKIIVYGLGNFYHKNITDIKKNYEVIGVSDTKIQDCENFIPKENIKKYKYDYIYITSPKYYTEIKQELGRVGIDADKIICPIIDRANEDILNVNINDRNKTSLTDGTPYVKLCKAATLDDKVFEHFRSNYYLIQTLEHVTNKCAKECLDIIIDNANLSQNELDRCNINDTVGKPLKCEFDIFNKTYSFAPTTIRYIKIADQIINELFDFNEIDSIVEIGIGYGGQCRILKELINKKIEYTLIDLPEVIGLAKKYLEYLKSGNNVNYLDGTQNIDLQNYDLVISNYAFSELNRAIQDKYLKEVILNSKHGYIIFNALSYTKWDGYSVNELLTIIPNSKIIDEVPLSYKENCIIVW